MVKCKRIPANVYGENFEELLPISSIELNANKNLYVERKDLEDIEKRAANSIVGFTYIENEYKELKKDVDIIVNSGILLNINSHTC